MKTVTCVICGEQVTKRQSLAHGDGRACRTHEEVVRLKETDKLRKNLETIFENSEWVRDDDKAKLLFGYLDETGSEPVFQVLAEADPVELKIEGMNKRSAEGILRVVEARAFALMWEKIIKDLEEKIEEMSE